MKKVNLEFFLDRECDVQQKRIAELKKYWIVNTFDNDDNLLLEIQKQCTGVTKILLTNLNRPESSVGGLTLCEKVRCVDKSTLIFMHATKDLLEDTDKRHKLYDLWGNILYSVEDLTKLFIDPVCSPIPKKKKPFIIGISGCSHSGKSSLTHGIQKHFQGIYEVGVIEQDRFFNHIYIKTVLENNWDKPGAIKHMELYQSLHKFCSLGYDIIIMEGYMIFYDPSLAVLCDLRFWINVDMKSAASRRNETQGMPVDYYEEIVWSNHLEYENHVRYMEACGWVSPIILDGVCDPKEVLNKAISHINKLFGEEPTCDII